jgi:hypothetical protein
MAIRRIGVTCSALVALLASATAASSASAEKLTLSEGGTALEAGDAFWLYGFNNLFVTAAGVMRKLARRGARKPKRRTKLNLGGEAQSGGLCRPVSS